MRLVIISDTHGLHKELAPLPEGDVLIHAGDLMSSGKKLDEVVDFTDWFAAQMHPHKFFIAGNHDNLFHSENYQMFFNHMAYLEQSEVIIPDPTQPKGRVHFWGSPWTPRPLGIKGSDTKRFAEDWSFMGQRGPEMKTHWDLIPPETDVLITHGPPQGIMDYMPKYGPDLGCGELLTATLRVKPKLHIFGHIHYSFGQRHWEGIHFINAAQTNDPPRGERAKIVNQPVVVNL